MLCIQTNKTFDIEVYYTIVTGLDLKDWAYPTFEVLINYLAN